VPIDKSGEWWKGSEYADLQEYLGLLDTEGYLVERVVQSVCTCGGIVFRLQADAEQGCAARTCVTCSARAFICDSGDYWGEAEPEWVRCSCGSERFEIGVGFAFRADGDVRWITIGVRCTACGVLGRPVDWKIDYGPTAHLLQQA